MSAGAQPISSTDGHLGVLLAAMGDGTTSRVKKLLTYYALGHAATNLTRTWVNKVVAEITYTVTVDSSDDIYPDLHAWVLARVPSQRQRSLIARSYRSGSVPVWSEEPDRSLRVFYDGRRTQPMRLGPHRVRVSVEQEEVGYPSNGGDSGWGQWKRDRVVFTVRGVAARDAVLAVLQEISDQRNTHHEACLYGPRWSEWSRLTSMPPRPLHSVVLRDGQKEDIIDDLGRFLRDEARYTALGLPWHRGYLFAGPPGTGKTSIAKAIAQHFDLDVYFLPLPSLANDAALHQMLGAVPARSVLLLEDIDIVHGARQRDDSEPGVTLSGLLNGLDGVITPHGLVMVMTTNKPDVLDEALVREGRVDRRFDFELLDDDQLRRLVAFAVGHPIGTAALPPLGDRQLSPAAVVEAIKPHLDNGRDAVAAVRSLLTS